MIGWATTNALPTMAPWGGTERVDAAIVQIHQCRRAPGVERLYVAGEQEFVRREEYGRAGIPLNQVTVRDIGATTRELGVEVDQYGWLG